MKDERNAIEAGESLTPVFDFVTAYRNSKGTRFHMPGHKGNAFLGPEGLDITEIKDADSLYEADGIIAKSEANAARIFRAKKTVYSTEGSSQCIKTMLALARVPGRDLHVMAPRNVHRSFVEGMALLGGTVTWIRPDKAASVYSVTLTKEDLEQALRNAGTPVDAVYVTTPDYLGNELSLTEIASFCKEHGLKLLVDHAHGAYLQFTGLYRHPLALGADFVAESAHKTLPVLTGGAYLHAGAGVSEELLSKMKKTMELFGSTSPSYLTLASLDLCNACLSDGYETRLKSLASKLSELKQRLTLAGFTVLSGEPCKITLKLSGRGRMLAEFLRENRIECEYSDPDYVVLMVTPENSEGDFETLEEVLQSFRKTAAFSENEESDIPAISALPETVTTIRDAVLGDFECIPIEESEGKIAANSAVSCPPAIPVVIPGEKITAECIAVMKYYGYRTIDVLRQPNLVNGTKRQ